MCGLVGIAGKLSYKDDATMQRLLLMDYTRGPDSTGFAAIRGSTGGNEIKIAKLCSHPIDLFQMPKFKDALKGESSVVFLGHNRAATRGGLSTYNAHPFQFGHIVGAHNGTLDYQSTKRLEDAAEESFPVDSMAIFAAIAKIGIDDTIALMEEGKEASTGAWSLVWYDSLEGSLNFLRNKHRPMWYAYTKEFDRIFWASEWPMIDAATRMSAGGYDLYTEGKENFKFFATDENVHYKFDVNLLKAGGDKRPRPKAKPLAGREPKPVAAAASSPFPHGNGHHCSQTTGSRTNSTTTSRGTTSSTESSKNVVHLLGDISNPFAGFVNKEKFDALAKYGCSYCSRDVYFGEPGITIFERDDILLCPLCSENDSDTSRIYVQNLDGVL